MTFRFPNLPKLSLWDIACLHAGQNATDDKPINDTRHKLAELAQAVFGGKLWVEFHPDVGFDFVTGFMPATARARVDTEWRKLDQVTVRREDWEHYERMLFENDRHEARLLLTKPYARLDQLARALVILAAGAQVQGEERYRKIHGVTRKLESLNLQFRTSDGLPSSQPKGVPVAGMDVREYQYLAVADVRVAAIEARYWPIEEQETLPMPPLVDLVSRPVRLPNATRVTVGWLAETIAVALVEIPDDKRLRTLKKEAPDGPGKWRIELLTGDDWRLIREICGGNPPISCSPAQFAAWRAPFNTASNRPDWDMRPEFQPSTEMQAAQSRWSLCNVQHLRQIKQKVESKEYSLITSTGIETSNLYDNAGLPVGYLRIADAKAYLDKCCIDWEITSTQTDTAASIAVAPEPNAVTVDTPQKSGQSVQRHVLTTTRNTPLSAEIKHAEKLAPDPGDVGSVWVELTKLAEQKWGAMVGYSSDGVQWRGKKYEESGVPDVFTKKNLSDRMGGAKRRATQRDKAR